MALIQVRDVPDQIYHLLVEAARRERRSLSQQVVAVLARGLEVEMDAKGRRRALLEAIRSKRPASAGELTDPVRLIREDRRR